MGYLRTDVISLFDLDFCADRIDSAHLNALEREAAKSEAIDSIYSDSFSWVFYGESLLECRRYNFPPPDGVPGAKCASLLVNAALGVAVYSVWQVYQEDCDPLRYKQEAWDSTPDCAEFLTQAGLEIKEIERQYPFVAVRIDREDVAVYCADHAVELGRIFTGNYERDEETYLRTVMNSNISHRDYERLFIRWTDVLAVYGEHVSDHEMERTMLRAVQIYEACILVRRLLRNLSEDAARLSSRLSRLVIPVPWAVDRITRQFLHIEGHLIVAPPVQSVEAERLLRAAYDSFGIGGIVEGARNSISLLDSRFQWSKAQFLVALGVMCFLLDKLKIFDLIARWLHLMK